MSKPSLIYELHPSPISLEGNLTLHPDAKDFIDPDDLTSVMTFLRHDGTFDGDITQAGGRNVTITLTKPKIEAYNAVQVSGGAYIPIGLESNTDTEAGVLVLDATKPKQIFPPAQTTEQFTHVYHIVELGELVERSEASPMGSYSKRLAEQKLAMTVLADEIESETLITPGVIGKYEFVNVPDGQGANATALLFAVPLNGERADNALISPLFAVSFARPELLMDALDIYMPPLMQTMGDIGKTAFDIHAAGYMHNELTLGNVLHVTANGDEEYLYVADWETAAPLQSNKVVPRVFDLVVAFRSFAGVINKLRSSANLPLNDGAAILSEGLIVLLAGYYGLEPQDAYRFLNAQQDVWYDAIAAAHRVKPKLKNFLPLVEMVSRLEKYAVDDKK